MNKKQEKIMHDAKKEFIDKEEFRWNNIHTNVDPPQI